MFPQWIAETWPPSLLTLRAGFLALPDEKIMGARVFDGLKDTLGVLSEAAAETPPKELARLRKAMETASARPRRIRLSLCGSTSSRLRRLPGK